jgi:hypothetical protein
MYIFSELERASGNLKAAYHNTQMIVLLISSILTQHVMERATWGTWAHPAEVKKSVVSM